MCLDCLFVYAVVEGICCFLSLPSGVSFEKVVFLPQINIEP